MTVESDTLRTLERIEKLLERSMASAGPGGPSQRPRVKVAGSARVTGGAAAPDKSVQQLGKAAAAAASQLKKFSSALGKLAGATNKDVIPAQKEHKKSTNEAADANRRLGKETDKQSASSSILSGMFRRLGLSVKDTGDKSEWLSGQFTTLGIQLTDALVNVTRDIFALQARGISASDSLFGLYGSAIKAGMSLEEYTAMLQDNSAAVVRARSFDEFSKDLESASKQLNKLGVFGPAATRLAASMRTNTVVLGISQDKQAGAVNSQVKMFEQLRKSTMMTADAFQELASDVANNQNVQEELLGLAPQERAARMEQIMQGATIGHRLGATAQASKQLTDALLEQRKATVQQRFQAAGYIRQAGAMIGMGAAETDELAKLRMKKRRTPEEEARFVELSGRLEQGLQAMQNTGNLQAEFLAEKMGELIGSTPQGAVQQAAGAIELQKQAGAVANAGIGKETSGFLQGIGQALTTLSGFMKNPLADAMVTFTSMLAQTGIQVVLMGRQIALLGVIARNTALHGGGAAGLPDIAAKGGKGAAGKGKGVIGAIGAAGKGIGNYISGVRGTASVIGTPLTIMGEMVSAFQGGWKMLSSVASGIKGIFMKGGPLAMAFGFMEELFTGESTKFLALGDGFGSRLIGAVIAGFNSFFTGITRLLDDGLNWVMEGLGLSFRFNITKVFDVATSYLVDGVKLILAGIVKVLAGSLEFFGFKDAPWVKSLRQTEESLYQSIAESSANREKLMETEGATMRSMGEAQIKAQKETEAKSKGLTKSTQDNVVYGIDALAASATRTVQGSQVAMPGPTQQQTVTPPEVNRSLAEADRKTEAAAKTKEGPAMSTTEETVLVLKQQLQVLQQMLTYWTSQEDMGEAFLKATSRPGLQSNEKLYAAVLGRQLSA